MVNPKRVWKKIFGHLPIGTLIVPKPHSRRTYPSFYIWYSDNTYHKIPTEKFVGRIVGHAPWNKRVYYVRWIADRRVYPKTRSFIWRESFFNEL